MSYDRMWRQTLNKDEKVELHITYLEVRHQIPS